jgi:hypothetical protein
MQDEHRPLVEVEPREPSVELVALRDRELVPGVARFHVMDHAQLDHHPAPLPSGVSVARPHEEPVEPGVEPIRITQPADVSPGLDERLLGRVLRSVPIAQDQGGDRIQPSERTRGERGEGFMIALPRPSCEVSLHSVTLVGTAPVVALTG